jgi:hypothetical protein
MTEPLKVMVGPSGHYHQLKSGEIKHQKSKPAKPIWRVLVLDESENKMHSRAFPSQPSAEEIEQVVLGVLQGQNLTSTHIVIPTTVEKLCPGLQEKLISQDATVYLPRHGFASGSRAGQEWEKFLSTLQWSLDRARESTASCEEIAAASGNPLGIVTSDLWRSDDKDASGFGVARDLADKIARSRGRDPEAGRKMRNSELFGAPLNRGNETLPPQDALAELLRDPNQYLSHERWGQPIWDIVLQLKRIRDAELEKQPLQLAELGASAVLHQIEGLRNNSDDFLSSLGFRLRDSSLRYQVSLGMKEAFKQLILLNNDLLQFSAAKVTVLYPKGCIELSLRGVPANHHLEKMVQELSGGRVTVIPDFADIRLKSYYHPITPVFLRIGGAFHSPYFAYRTPRSPAQCFISTAKAGTQRVEGLLLILAILPKDTTRYVPLGDATLAERMTDVINERLARTGKGITCQVAPVESYGDLMEIDPLSKD